MNIVTILFWVAVVTIALNVLLSAVALAFISKKADKTVQIIRWWGVFSVFLLVIPSIFIGIALDKIHKRDHSHAVTMLKNRLIAVATLLGVHLIVSLVCISFPAGVNHRIVFAISVADVIVLLSLLLVDHQQASHL